MHLNATVPWGPSPTHHFMETHHLQQAGNHVDIFRRKRWKKPPPRLREQFVAASSDRSLRNSVRAEITFFFSLWKSHNTAPWLEGRFGSESTPLESFSTESLSVPLASVPTECVRWRESIQSAKLVPLTRVNVVAVDSSFRVGTAPFSNGSWKLVALSWVEIGVWRKTGPGWLSQQIRSFRASVVMESASSITYWMPSSVTSASQSNGSVRWPPSSPGPVQRDKQKNYHLWIIQFYKIAIGQVDQRCSSAMVDGYVNLRLTSSSAWISIVTIGVSAMSAFIPWRQRSTCTV